MKYKEKKRFLKNEQALATWDNFKGSNICISEVPKEEEGEGKTEIIFKGVMAENLPNLMKPMNSLIQVQQTPSARNWKKTTPKHIIIKLLKTSDKEKNLKSNQKGKRHVTYKVKKYKDDRHS